MVYALVLQLLHLSSSPVCSLWVQDVFFCLQGPCHDPHFFLSFFFLNLLYRKLCTVPA